MRNYLRVVFVLAVCLFTAMFVRPAAAEPKQNFGPASGTIPDAEAPQSTKPKPMPPAGDSSEVKKLRAELDAARAEAAQAKRNAARVADLEKENRDLSAKLEAAEKKASAKPMMPVDSAEVKNLRADLDKSRGDLEKSRAEVAELKKQVAAKPAVAVDSGEVKSLRAQLGDARKEAEHAKSKSAARAAELEKQNADLSAKLAAAEKTTAGAPTEAPDARIMKRLREENSYLRNLLDTYSAKNPELKGQLRRYEQ
jgi:hypothetical protein